MNSTSKVLNARSVYEFDHNFLGFWILLWPGSSSISFQVRQTIDAVFIGEQVNRLLHLIFVPFKFSGQNEFCGRNRRTVVPFP